MLLHSNGTRMTSHTSLPLLLITVLLTPHLRAAMLPGAIDNDGSGNPLGNLTASASSFVALDREPAHLVDGSGLELSIGGNASDPLDYENREFDAFGRQDSWLSDNGDTTPWVRIDLGQEYDLDTAHIFNYNPTDNGRKNRGASSANLYVSTVLNPGNDFTNVAEWTQVGSTFAITRAPNDSAQLDADLFSFGGMTARHVALDLLGNHGDSTFTGLGEIQFFAIPEPSSFLLMGLALCTGLVSRRRR